MNPVAVVDRRQLILVLWILLTTGFVAITSISYQVSKRAIREALIGQDLPLTSSNIYSEIQKDLVRPVLISSTMAHDTFVRDWVLDGERDVTAMARFLKEVKICASAPGSAPWCRGLSRSSAAPGSTRPMATTSSCT